MASGTGATAGRAGTGGRAEPGGLCGRALSWARGRERIGNLSSPDYHTTWSRFDRTVHAGRPRRRLVPPVSEHVEVAAAVGCGHASGDDW